MALTRSATPAHAGAGAAPARRATHEAAPKCRQRPAPFAGGAVRRALAVVLARPCSSGSTSPRPKGSHRPPGVSRRRYGEPAAAAVTRADRRAAAATPGRAWPPRRGQHGPRPAGRAQSVGASLNRPRPSGGTRPEFDEVWCEDEARRGGWRPVALGAGDCLEYRTVV